MSLYIALKEMQERIQGLEVQVLKLESDLAKVRRAYCDEYASTHKRKPVREDAPATSCPPSGYENRVNRNDYDEEHGV